MNLNCIYCANCLGILVLKLNTYVDIVCIMPALGRLFALEDCLYALGGQGCKTYIYIEVLQTGSLKQLSGCLNNHMFCLLAQCVHSYVATRREGENLLASGHVYIADSGSAKNCSARSLSWLGCP